MKLKVLVLGQSPVFGWSSHLKAPFDCLVLGVLAIGGLKEYYAYL